jgi:hypothetical protein
VFGGQAKDNTDAHASVAFHGTQQGVCYAILLRLPTHKKRLCVAQQYNVAGKPPAKNGNLTRKACE